MPHLHAGRRQQHRQTRKRCHKCQGRSSHATCVRRPRPPCSDASGPPPGRRRCARAQPAATWTLTHAGQQSAPAPRLQLLRLRRRARAQQATTGALPHTLRQGARAAAASPPARPRCATQVTSWVTWAGTAVCAAAHAASAAGAAAGCAALLCPMGPGVAALVRRARCLRLRAADTWSLAMQDLPRVWCTSLRKPA